MRLLGYYNTEGNLIKPQLVCYSCAPWLNYNTEGNLIKPQLLNVLITTSEDYNTEGNLIKPQPCVLD